MLEVCLALCAVSSTLSVVFVVRELRLSQAKLLDHIRDTVQIGGTPIGLASKQTDFEMARIQNEKQQHENLMQQMRQMREEMENPRGPLS